MTSGDFGGQNSNGGPRSAAEPGEVFCPSCGSVIRATVTLCSECGVKISAHLRQLANANIAEFGDHSRENSDTRCEGLADRNSKSLRFLPALFFVAVGGFAAIPGAIQGELISGFMGPWLWAPIVEEILKPSGIYLLLLKWPSSVRSRFQTGLYGALAGLVFGLLESLIYVTIYYSDPTQQEVIIRFTLPVSMHVVASFIFALGISRQLPRLLTTRGEFPVSSWGFFLIAIVLHSSYNVIVGIVWPIASLF